MNRGNVRIISVVLHEKTDDIRLKFMSRVLKNKCANIYMIVDLYKILFHKLYA